MIDSLRSIIPLRPSTSVDSNSALSSNVTSEAATAGSSSLSTTASRALLVDSSDDMATPSSARQGTLVPISPLGTLRRHTHCGYPLNAATVQLLCESRTLTIHIALRVSTERPDHDFGSGTGPLDASEEPRYAANPRHAAATPQASRPATRTRATRHLCGGQSVGVGNVRPGPARSPPCPRHRRQPRSVRIDIPRRVGQRRDPRLPRLHHSRACRGPDAA